MTVSVQGKISPEGKVLQGNGIAVKQLTPVKGKGWLRFRIQLTGLATLIDVEEVRSTSERSGGAAGEVVEPKAKSTFDDVDHPKKSFVVTAGYTRVPPGKPKGGHHGFTFVAVGESQGRG